MLAAGRMVGGAAKAALIGSALFGTISGSAVANVAAVGVLTIPLMRRAGYTAEQAVATEAIGSTGGQLMPPVMGIAAFVMADILGVPYTRIALAAPMLRKDTRYDRHKLWEIALDVPKQMAMLSIPLCTIGIIMTVATQSNLALKFVTGLTTLGGGHLYLSLLLIVIGCLIMGMGLPTVAAYIIGSGVFVPALVGMGVDRPPAPFFVMFFCGLSMVTPPVALASFAAAGMAKADAMKTGMLATGLGAVSFLIPFGFVTDPIVLWNGPITSILIAFFGMMCAIVAWAMFIQGWMNQTLSWIERLICLGLCVGIVLIKSLDPIWFALLAGFWAMIGWCFLLRPRVFVDHSAPKAPVASMTAEELFAQAPRESHVE